MKCSKIRNMLSPYMDGELTDARKALVESHLKTCAGCSEALASLRGLHAAFAGLERPAVPYRFAERVMSRVKEGPARTPVLVPALTRLLEAAVIAAIVLIGIKAGNVLGGSFVTQKPTLVSSLSLDSFEPFQPDSVGGAYMAVMEADNEK